ncbi:hypothetical protein D3C73_555100 [compost metagenome]
MMPAVKCSVANCTHWVQGNNCNADTILIDIDQHANAKYDAEFANDFDADHKDAANKAANTCCHTFELKK